MKQTRFERLKYEKKVNEFGITFFNFELDDIRGFATVEPATKNWHDANTSMVFPEGRYVQTSKLNPTMLKTDEEAAVFMLALGCQEAYKKAILTPTPLP